ncbi:hypothetical protein DFP72DRAFT_1052161 [Ephemerocybe angulata]|uniref:MRG domain-containing protein n=1 Tax=Ephemerocybe angulata TaxID=980116 RepID=A0A8H6HEP3_9AGAR|nr:hypothetical protein DFP72DRAFT_1052161 [Tulosesus angulatus]
MRPELQKALKAAHDHPPSPATPDSPPSLLVDPGRVLPSIHMQAARVEAWCKGCLWGNECEWAADGRRSAQTRDEPRRSSDAEQAAGERLGDCMTIPYPRDPTVVETLKFAEYRGVRVENGHCEPRVRASWLRHSVVWENPPNLKDPNLLLPTITPGLQCYFGKAFGSKLQPPLPLRAKANEMSEVFGAEHFLRMMAQSALDPESVSLLKEYARELLLYMDRERERLFRTQDEYEYRGADYQTKHGRRPLFWHSPLRCLPFLRLLSICKSKPCILTFVRSNSEYYPPFIQPFLILEVHYPAISVSTGSSLASGSMSEILEVRPSSSHPTVTLADRAWSGEAEMYIEETDAKSNPWTG